MTKTFRNRRYSFYWWQLILLFGSIMTNVVVVMAHVHSDLSHILSGMTLEDQIYQMGQVDINLLTEDDPNISGKKRLSQEKVIEVVGKHGIGSVLNYVQGIPWTAKDYRQAVIELNSVAYNYSRPPIIWGLDSVHGANYIHGAVITPQPINLAATFNTSIAQRAGFLSSRDTRAAGITWLFAPLLGIALELQWSRVYETFGEDPVVVRDMASSFITGIQTKDEDNIVPNHAAACAKHFVGYSRPNHGHDRSPSWIPQRHLYQYFIPPWKMAIQQANVLTVMESYTEIDGVPNVANINTLDYLLRQRLGFNGVLVTDYEEILNLKKWHHTTKTDEQAVIQSLREGSVDMSMIPWNDIDFKNSVMSGIENYKNHSTTSSVLVEERITQSVERILKLKDSLHMFDHEYEHMTSDDPNIAKIGSKDDIQEVLGMAHQSIVLAKNDDNALPLTKSSSTTTKTRVLVTGPTANSLITQSGGWTGEWQGASNEKDYFTYGSTVFQAMQAKASKFSWEVRFACGTDALGKDCGKDGDQPLQEWTSRNTDENDGGVMETVNNAVGKFKDWAGLGGNDEPSNSMEVAVNLAADSDVVIVCIGEEAYTEKPGDIRSMDLPAGQYELVSLIQRNSNAKIILVYLGGRPRLLEPIVEYCDAILLAFLPGPSAGTAIADIVTGDVNPSGKLPITYPKYDDGAGAPYFRAISDQCTKPDPDKPLPHYEYQPCEVQWPFGHGLSYSNFEYSNLALSSKTIHYQHIGKRQPQEVESVNNHDTFTVSIDIKNKGPFAGAETIFFFTFDEARSVTPEYKRLRAFEKVYLEKGEETTVSVNIPINDLKFVGPHDDTHYIFEHGLQFRVGIGAETDCRVEDADERSVLCSDFITVDAGDDYIAACEAACEIWSTSGCATEFSFSDKKCWNLCTSVSKNDDVIQHLGEGEDGWGWNYVRCLESVVWGFQQGGHHHFDSKHQCGKMTALCRDIFATQEIDPFGHGSESFGRKSLGQSIIGICIAFLVGAIAAALMMYALRGGFQKGGGPLGNIGSIAGGASSRNGDVQFVRVPNNEENLTL